MLSKLKIKILRWVVKAATRLGVPSDKMLHFLCAFACMISMSLVFNECVGLLATFAVSIGKELYDKFSGKGCAEWGDLLADIIGIAIGWLVVAIV